MLQSVTAHARSDAVVGACSAGLIVMPVARLVTACDESRVLPQAMGRTDAAERYCASSDAAVGACSAGLIVMLVSSLVAQMLQSVTVQAQVQLWMFALQD